LQLPELYAFTQVSPILTIETPLRLAEIIRREKGIDIPTGMPVRRSQRLPSCSGPYHCRCILQYMVFWRINMT